MMEVDPASFLQRLVLWPSPDWTFEKVIVNVHESSTLDPGSHGSLGCQRAPCAVSTVKERLTPPGQE